MSNELQYYDAAKVALAKAAKVDEVKSIRDHAEQMKLYGRQSKNKELEAKAAEIRKRATRRLGQLIAEQKKTVGLNKGGKSEHRNRVKRQPGKATLAEAGIDKNLANRARKEAALSPEQHEQQIADEQARITRLKLKEKKPAVVTMPGAVEQCAANVRNIVEQAVQQLRRGGAGNQKIRYLFQTLFDELRGIENKMLPPTKPAEESADKRKAGYAEAENRSKEDERIGKVALDLGNSVNRAIEKAARS
jgi:hypothetical protein